MHSSQFLNHIFHHISVAWHGMADLKHVHGHPLRLQRHLPTAEALASDLFGWKKIRTQENCYATCIMSLPYPARLFPGLTAPLANGNCTNSSNLNLCSQHNIQVLTVVGSDWQPPSGSANKYHVTWN